MTLAQHVSDLIIRAVKTLIVTLIVYFAIMIGTYSLITGEFPPKFANIKAGVQRTRQLLNTSESLISKLNPNTQAIAEVGQDPIQAIAAQIQNMNLADLQNPPEIQSLKKEIALLKEEVQGLKQEIAKIKK